MMDFSVFSNAQQITAAYNKGPMLRAFGNAAEEGCIPYTLSFGPEVIRAIKLTDAYMAAAWGEDAFSFLDYKARDYNMLLACLSEFNGVLGYDEVSELIIGDLKELAFSEGPLVDLGLLTLGAIRLSQDASKEVRE